MSAEKSPYLGAVESLVANIDENQVIVSAARHDVVALGLKSLVERLAVGENLALRECGDRRAAERKNKYKRAEVKRRDETTDIGGGRDRERERRG